MSFAAGEIRDYIRGGNRARVLIVSRDDVSNDAYPIVVPIVRQGADIPPYTIALTEQDPVSGYVEVALITALTDPDSLGPVVGTIGGATWQRVLQAVHDLIAE